MFRSSLIASVAVLAIAAAPLAAQKAQTAWANGRIERFDNTAKTLVIKQGSHDMTFTLASDAQVLVGKKPLTTGDIAANVGHDVKVEYRMSGSTRTAMRVEIADTQGKSKSPAKR